MQNLRFSIAAGETKVFVIAGRYLEIIEATGPVTLGLYDENSSQTDDAKDVLSGTFMEGVFSQFEVYSATAQTVELFLTATRGGTRRQPGNVRVIDDITDAIQTAAFQGVTDVTAFSVQQLVAPAANVAGMMLRMASAGGAAGAGGSTTARIMACKSTPTALFIGVDLPLDTLQAAIETLRP